MRVRVWHACSRAKTLEGLQICGSIHPRALQANPRVIAFYAKLEA